MVQVAVQRAYHTRDRIEAAGNCIPGGLHQPIGGGLKYLAICMQCPPSVLNLLHFERLMINSLVWRFYECLLRSKAVGCERFQLIPARGLP